MKLSKTPLVVTVLIGTFVLSGCAHQRKMHSLPSEVEELRQMTELANRNANQALQETESLKSEVAAARQASEAASADAAATRRLLEQMNNKLNAGGTKLN